MKESDNLQITTTSLTLFLEEILKKQVKDILLSDLLLIETLTIDGKDDFGKKQVISFQDLKQFQNLKYLEICNTLITTSTINIISKLKYLENIIFRNCTFSTTIKNLSKLTNIQRIRIINCKKFKSSFLSNSLNLKEIFLSHQVLDNINDFSNLNLYSLDLSECIINSFLGINELKVKNLVISHNQYIKNLNIIEKCQFKIIIISETGYYIEKWLNE